MSEKKESTEDGMEKNNEVTLQTLKRFCHVSRPLMAEPFSQGEYSYATDGKIAIRIQRLDVIGEKTGAPQMDRLPWDHKDIDGWLGFPYYDTTTLDKCGVCHGIGTIRDCPECDGDGVVLLDNEYNEYEFTCQTCTGDSSLPGDLIEARNCPVCGGTGTDLSAVISWGAGHIAITLLEKIKSLPDARLSLIGDGCVPFMFIFLGGEGIVMGTSRGE